MRLDRGVAPVPQQGEESPHCIPSPVARDLVPTDDQGLRYHPGVAGLIFSDSSFAFKHDQSDREADAHGTGEQYQE